MLLKIRTSFLTLVGSLAVLFWHHQVTGGKLILSDIPGDPKVSEGWPWVIGALGLLGLGATLVLFGRENETLARRQRRLAERAGVLANDEARVAENRRRRLIAEFENYQGGRRISRT